MPLLAPINDILYIYFLCISLMFVPVCVIDSRDNNVPGSMIYDQREDFPLCEVLSGEVT